jgi:hypothetical protein
MATTLELPRDERKSLLETAPPIAATTAVETQNIGEMVKDTYSRQALNKSNAAVSTLLKDSLKTTMKLAKTVFGEVSGVFTVFSGLKRIMGGL